jgi:hypothetical protein
MMIATDCTGHWRDNLTFTPSSGYGPFPATRPVRRGHDVAQPRMRDELHPAQAFLFQPSLFVVPKMSMMSGRSLSDACATYWPPCLFRSRLNSLYLTNTGSGYGLRSFRNRGLLPLDVRHRSDRSVQILVDPDLGSPGLDSDLVPRLQVNRATSVLSI